MIRRRRMALAEIASAIYGIFSSWLMARKRKRYISLSSLALMAAGLGLRHQMITAVSFYNFIASIEDWPPLLIDILRRRTIKRTPEIIY